MRSLLLFLGCVMGIVGAKPLIAADCLTLSFLGAGFTSEDDKQRFERIFQNDGICVNVIRMPNERAKAALLSGEIDGEVGRSEGYEAVVSPTAIRVPAVLMEVDLFLLTKDPNINAVSDVKSGEIGYIRGFKTHEDALATLGISGIAVDSFDALYRLMNAGRVKAIPVDSIAIEMMQAHASGMKTFPLTRFATYVYVHSRHAGLVPQMTEIIQNHIATGNDFIPGGTKKAVTP